MASIKISGKMAAKNKLSSSPFNLQHTEETTNHWNPSNWWKWSQNGCLKNSKLLVTSGYHVYLKSGYYLHYCFIVEKKQQIKHFEPHVLFLVTTAMFFYLWKNSNDQFMQDTLKTIMPTFIKFCDMVSELYISKTIKKSISGALTHTSGNKSFWKFWHSP